MRRLADAILQIDSVECECVEVINQVEGFCLADKAGHRSEIFRLMAIPMIYSAWERAFRISTAVAIRFLFESPPTVSELSSDQKALLLQKEAFYKSYIDKNLPQKGSRGPRKGEFENLSELLDRFEFWSVSKANLGTDAEEYVMTFSNVDHTVLRLHEKILGSGQTLERDTGLPIDLSPLGELLNRRNDISHGGSMQPPGEKNLDDLFKFTKSLLTSYCDSMRTVIRKYNPTPESRKRLRGYKIRQYRSRDYLKTVNRKHT